MEDGSLLAESLLGFGRDGERWCGGHRRNFNQSANVNIVENAHIFGKSERNECETAGINFAPVSLASVITHWRDIDRGDISDRSCHLASCQASLSVYRRAYVCIPRVHAYTYSYVCKDGGLPSWMRRGERASRLMSYLRELAFYESRRLGTLISR